MTNKHWITPSSCLIWFSLSIGTHNLRAFHGLEINYRVKGVHHTLADGLTKLELNEILLTTNHDLKIERFKITLSRGNRAVKTMDVIDDRFDLRKFIGVVR